MEFEIQEVETGIREWNPESREGNPVLGREIRNPGKGIRIQGGKFGIQRGGKFGIQRGGKFGIQGREIRSPGREIRNTGREIRNPGEGNSEYNCYVALFYPYSGYI